MWWSDLFTDMNPTDFFNFSFLPKYGTAFVRGIEYTLLLAVVSVLLAILPALGLALMRLSRKKPVRWLSGAYIAVFRSTPMLVHLLRPVLRHLPAPADPLRLRGYQPLHPRRGGAGPE